MSERPKYSSNPAGIYHWIKTDAAVALRDLRSANLA
jgi:hypothetical protein